MVLNELVLMGQVKRTNGRGVLNGRELMVVHECKGRKTYVLLHLYPELGNSVIFVWYLLE